ncbi:MAG: peptidoglycan-associated lipoprotein Pal [bacterium]|nr:MAG: peptidoglycan-associated lipoprotein Pal [bacterium]
MARYKWLVLLLVLVLILPACAKKETVPIKEEEPVEEVPPPPPPPPLEEEEEEPIEVEEEEPIVLNDVFFDFDKYNIKNEFKGVLAANADVLLTHSEIELTIEGHCDERGTNEYNLSLGERRARAVIDFYVAYGVDSGRLAIISYGEERPFARGHNEEAWAQNRRAHMVIK